MSSPIYARGAMLLLFDIPLPAVEEHDHWHSHEHMPERLAIPGFVRGTRWMALDAPGSYCILYEVAALAALDSAAYRDRLDNPTPWTASIMHHYHNMRRTLCTVVASSGWGLGGTALIVPFAPMPGRDGELEQWVVHEVLPSFAQRPGLARAQFYRNALVASMTREQQIRGRDAALHSALFVTGYDESVVAALAREELAPAAFVAHGAAQAEPGGLYRQAFALSATEVRKGA